jgi:hypothetical protein
VSSFCFISSTGKWNIVCWLSKREIWDLNSRQGGDEELEDLVEGVEEPKKKIRALPQAMQ